MLFTLSVSKIFVVDSADFPKFLETLEIVHNKREMQHMKVTKKKPSKPLLAKPKNHFIPMICGEADNRTFGFKQKKKYFAMLLHHLAECENHTQPIIEKKLIIKHEYTHNQIISVIKSLSPNCKGITLPVDPSSNGPAEVLYFIETDGSSEMFPQRLPGFFSSKSGRGIVFSDGKPRDFIPFMGRMLVSCLAD